MAHAGGRPKVDDADKAKKRSCSMTDNEWDRLCRYCQQQEWQPSVSDVIRRALDQFFESKGFE